VHDQVYLYEGSFSAEHGIGQAKVAELLERKSTTEMNLMRAFNQTQLGPALHYESKQSRFTKSELTLEAP
jgi:hypothetical protein